MDERSREDDSGDRRVWSGELARARRLVEAGDVADARRLLARLAEEAPYEEIRKDAAELSKQFKMDWLAFVFFGATLLVLVLIVLKYY